MSAGGPGGVSGGITVSLERLNHEGCSGVKLLKNRELVSLNFTLRSLCFQKSAVNGIFKSLWLNVRVSRNIRVWAYQIATMI